MRTRIALAALGVLAVGTVLVGGATPAQANPIVVAAGFEVLGAQPDGPLDVIVPTPYATLCETGRVDAGTIGWAMVVVCVPRP